MKQSFRPHQGIIEFNMWIDINVKIKSFIKVSVPIRGLLNLTECESCTYEEIYSNLFPSPSGDY